jgi:hypothetical protein
MPTSVYEDEVEELCGVIEEILEDDGKGGTNSIIVRDWNSVSGDKSYHKIVVPHGFGWRNQGSQMLIDVCERN